MTNREWIDLFTKEFNVSRTSARDMLHQIMAIKRHDNFKKQMEMERRTYNEKLDTDRRRIN